MKRQGCCWHVHHNILMEWCYNYVESVHAIKTTKPPFEIPSRLRLFKPVKGELPAGIVRAQESQQKAYAVWRKAPAAQQKAYAAWRKAYVAHYPEIEALHAAECGCKEWNGKKLVFLSART